MKNKIAVARNAILKNIYAVFPCLLLAASLSFAQTTYSKQEERMAHYLNNSLAYAVKYDSLQRIQPALDSCSRFLRKYPNSFMKPNVFDYMLKMTAMTTTDTSRIFPLVDSVLAYDSTATTKLEIGETLIEQEIAPDRGAQLILEALPHLTYGYHRYLSHLLLSRVDLSNGNYPSALMHIEAAISIDSTRLDAWYAYLGYSQLSEDPAGIARASRKIGEIREHRYHEYMKAVGNNELIGRSIYDMEAPDMDGKTVRFRNFAGKVLAIQQFNFWCSTAAKEFPAIKRLIKDFPRVKFVFINAGERPSELRERYFTRPSSAFLKDQLIVFSDSSTRSSYGSFFVVGQVLLVDKHGIVRYSFPGMSKNFEVILRERLQKLTHDK